MRFTASPDSDRTADDLLRMVDRLDEPLAKVVAITSIDLDRLDDEDRAHMLALARELAVEATGVVAEVRRRAAEAVVEQITVDLRNEVATPAA